MKSIKDKKGAIMLGFFIGLFFGSTVTLIVAACFSQEREHEAYWQGYLQCAEDDKIVRRERSSNETDI